MQILMKQTVLLIIFLLSTITSSFAFEKKVFSRSEFIKNDDCIFLQNSIFGDFSIEREKDSYGIGKIENGDVIENHYYKEGEYYNCRAKSILPSGNSDGKAFFYINDDDLVGAICTVWIDKSGSFERILFDWNDESDLRKPICDYAEIELRADGTIKKYKVPIHIKEIDFKFLSYINADDIVIDVSNRFSNLEQIRFFYVNQDNKIIVNCADNVRVNKG